MTEFAAKVTFTAPSGVGVADDLPAIVSGNIVDKQLKGFTLMSLNEVIQVVVFL